MRETQNDTPVASPAPAQLVFTVSRGFLWRLLVLIAAVILVCFAGEVLVVAFAGILLAVVLGTFTGWAQRVTHLGRGWAYGLVIFLIAGLAVGALLLAGPRIVSQASEIAKVIPQSLHRSEGALNQYSWGPYLAQAAHRGLERLDIARKLSTWADGIVALTTKFVVVLAIGFLAALDPALYRNLFLQFLPEGHRSKAEHLLHRIGYTLQWWFIGQLVPMTVLGVGTFLGLWLLNVPLAFILALFTALMLFIPYAGSVVAFIPSVLVALMRGPITAIYVVGLYLAIHILEGYVITPLVQRRAVRLPPAFTVVLQLLMWTVAGLLGVMIATPLGAACLVTVKELYLKDQPVPQG